MSQIMKNVDLDRNDESLNVAETEVVTIIVSDLKITVITTK
jgi:hypothetical protein